MNSLIGRPYHKLDRNRWPDVAALVMALALGGSLSVLRTRPAKVLREL
jgi:hypothetical protein